MNKPKLSALIPGQTPIRNSYNINPDEIALARMSIKRGRGSIRRFKEWTYASENHIIAIEDGDLFLNRFTSLICRSYFTNMKSFLFSNDKKMDYDLEPTIFRLARRLSRTTQDTTIQCRLIMPSSTFIMEAKLYPNSIITFTTLLFDDTHKLCKCCFDRFGNTVERRLIRSNSAFYLSQKNKLTEKFILSESDTWVTDEYTQFLIYQCLELLSNDLKLPSEQYDMLHSENEMYFIKMMISSVTNGRNMWPIDIFNKFADRNDEVDLKIFDRVMLDVVEMTITKSHQFPLVDLNQKEIKFISNYVQKNKFLSGEDSKEFNIIPYLSHLEYGESFQYPIIYEDGSRNIILTSFVLVEEQELLRVFMMQKISEELTVFSYIDFNNLSNFHIGRSLVHMNSSVIFTDFKNLPRSQELVKDMIPNEFLDTTEIFLTVRGILALYIVMRDRPTRTRMIKCTTTIPSERKRSSQKNQEEREFVVTRILKTVNDAKEYVAKMTEEGEINREYVLESWQRRGHYRKYQDGAIVWIPKTTCRRQLPLSEKEIHIKL